LSIAEVEHDAGAGRAGTRAVAFDKVSVGFAVPGGASYRAVAEISLRIAAHEFVSIVGPTGCGKSTLLNVAAGLLAPSSGSTFVFGAPLQGLNQAAGYLFQQDAVMPWKSALDNVAIGLEVAGTPRRAALEQARTWLGRVGLSAFADRYPHQLSGGQRKRVGLAQVLIRDPKLLLMDEPFGPLDAQTRQIMGNLLLELWAADRKAVLFVTHDLEEAIALSDRVVIMSAGPEARIIGDHPIDLGRPRDAAEVRLQPRFHELHKAIWDQLRGEVLKGYTATGGG
jgi:NitT/TauT family transport system ATP-binding protein